MIDIKGYEGRYAIDEKGKVWSYPKTGSGCHNGQYLKYLTSTTGYYYVTLRKYGKQKHHFIHRLLSQHFSANPLNKPDVNHIDGNKLNNALSNLEWVTEKENTQHAVRTGLMNNNGVRNGNAKMTPREVIKMRLMNRLGFPRRSIVASTGYHSQTVSGIINYKSWKHIQ